jgi:hypothetical protein
LELSGWGTWTRVDSCFLSGFSANPPNRRNPETGNRFTFDFPKKWDGSIRVRYDLLLVEFGSNVQQRFGLLPYRAGQDTFGFSQNTLMRPLRKKVVIPSERKLEIAAPSGWKVATGNDG